MSSSSSAVMKPIKIIISLVWAYICLCKVLPYIIFKAYDIRLHAINEFGPIIHEFDPYFNFRATEYLYYNGWKKFVTWFDYKVWYPLGRPVGTTIYPGMQVTAVFIKNYIVPKMSLNDICVYIPAWFGAIATAMTGLLGYECSLPIVVGGGGEGEDDGQAPFGSILENIPLVSWIYTNVILKILSYVLKAITFIFGSDLGLSAKAALPAISKKEKIVEVSSPAVEIGLIAASIMAIVPAHMMRSIGGGYDNESIANTAMTMTFYFWCRALRGGVNYDSWKTLVWATLTAIAYFYMVAVWGGYVFVVNLIGVHAAILVLLGRFGPKVYKAYTIYYALGTFLATRVPVVGMTPLKSLEQLGPALVFFGYQLLAFCEYQRKKRNMSKLEAWKFRIAVFAVATIIAAAAAFVLDQYLGYFGPISARVRGLFVKHTKTGNPLVDSVAEHQPASSEAYKQYLGESIVKIAPFGFVLVALRYFHDSSSFLLVYGVTTYFFSHKMVRLILLTAPIASVFSGIALGRLLSFFLYNAIGFSPSLFDIFFMGGTDASNDQQMNIEKNKKDNDENKTNAKKPTSSYVNIARSLVIKCISISAAITIFAHNIHDPAKDFIANSEKIAVAMSNPTIIIKAQLRSGETVKVDDYRSCYWYLRDNTPEDARVLAWWDYGYQITAIANRTTIADGNTWNHEHIALLGRALTSSEKEGHRIARHLADYVLVWAGGGGDDLAKSPHLARIANSVYRSMCPGDPTCSQFGYTQYGPSKMMQESLLYKLVGHAVKDNVFADPNRFQHKFTSKYGKCRVFKIQSVSHESKKWVANPENRDCDAPGSWFCRGQYPPGMKKILAEKRDFSQLEDFNKDEDDSEYQRQYFENLNKKHKQASDPKPSPSSESKKVWKPDHEVSEEMIEELNKRSNWENNEQTSAIWQLISENRVRELMAVLKEHPELGHLRSEDGRGSMWWAMEANNAKIVRILKRVGVRDDFKDGKGLTPKDMLKKEEL